ncbi:5-dehydro-4-deoxy-D-glucuronate isomerase [Sphingomonas sp. HF-S3]|uniref:5-dehydro-4-deoxy-D-glucuronate isomerase n=1 Tax=Sphingomonas rustica TaxID=3103142 RepID=A0ABV0B630_9SPHN
MFARTYYGTHPDMMAGASNADLRDRYLIHDLFREGACVLAYTHADRLIIGGVRVGAGPVSLPRQQEPPSAAGRSLLERREMGIFNVGAVEGVVTVDGTAFALAPKHCLYVGMGADEVVFSGSGARFYLASSPAHRAFPTRRIGLDDAAILVRGTAEEANARRIHQMILPGTCDSAQLAMGLTILEPGSVWNTMPPHVHERRSEIYFYFDLPDVAQDRVVHFMGQGEATRSVVLQDGEAVISPPWSIHMGVGTRAYAFIWTMAGENLDYSDMDVLDLCQLM